MASSKLRLKLLIDTRNQKVLFAEASKDFVDFLFYLLSLPVATVVKLLKKKNMVGCLGQLYESIENLSETYMQPHQSKNSVLDPRSSTCSVGLPLLLSDHEFKTQKFYTCSNNVAGFPSGASPFSMGSSPGYHHYVTDVPNLTCPHCKAIMNREMSYISPAAANRGKVVEGGFVKEVVTYMVMDNLEVMPMSTISSITLLNKFNVKDVGALAERILDFGTDEGLKLLKASLESKAVLTSVFLGTTGQENRNCT